MAEATTDLFINLIQNHPIIFDKKSKDFKNIKKKEAAWVEIGNQSRMTVDAAKKRYFSLRQKYCREKRNVEIKRRNKEMLRKNWVYYDRLQFLDTFIQPRATFTNDTSFNEYDENIVDEGDILNLEEGNVDAPQIISIEVESEIDTNEINGLLRSDQGNCTQTLQTTSEQIDDSTLDSINFDTEVQSRYSGEVSSVHYPRRTARDDEFLQENTSTPTETINVDRLQKSVDPDNYMSAQPTTTSRVRSLSHNLTSDENLTASATPMIIVGNRPLCSSQSSQQQLQSRQNAAIHHNANTSRRGGVPPLSSVSNQTGPTSSIHKGLPPRVSNITTSSREKALDAIRNKMDSCLNAISNKVADKSQRSPHAPFLAYLGTKLPSVPKDRISDVESKILELVKFYST